MIRKNPPSERDVLDALEKRGPLSGAELIEATGFDIMPLWRLCRSSSRIVHEVVGRRFLRLDRDVDGYARLSPSIRREFLTYTILGLDSRAGEIAARARRLREEIESISLAKIALARENMTACVSELPERDAVLDEACFLIAGDVTYGMSHRVPRPERSTGQMVRGSDLDVIVVVDDAMPASRSEALDDAILKRKHYLLVHPDIREEVDYLIKPVARVRAQVRFDTFESMVACKILHEGRFLYGSRRVFDMVKGLVAESGVPTKLAELDDAAVCSRELAEKALLSAPDDDFARAHLNLFYTSEEGDEIY